MHILKRLLLLCFMGAGVQALRSQPATPGEVKEGPETTRKEQAGQKVTKTEDRSAVISTPLPGTAMDAEAEQRARELLNRLTTGLTPLPPEKSLLPKREVRVKTGNASQPASASIVTTNSIADRAAEEALREKEIARIEAVVEEARKRRAQTAAPATYAPTLSTQVRSVPTSVPSSVTTAAVPPPAPISADASAAPVVTSPVPAVDVAATAATVPSPSTLPPGIPASPDQSTLTADAEKKARDLVRQKTIILFSDNATPQAIPRPESSGSARSSGFLIDAATPPKDITVALADTPNARVAAPAPSSGTLSAEQEQKARDLLNQLTGKSNATSPTKPAAPASPRSNVLPRPAPPALDLPTNSVSASAPIQTPKAQPALSAPVTSLPAPASATLSQDQETKARDLLNQSYPEVSHGKAFTVAVPPPAATPAPIPQPSPIAAPATRTAPMVRNGLTPEQEASARSLVSQQVSNLRQGATAPAVPLPPPIVATPAPTPQPVTSPSVPALPAPVAPASTPTRPTPPAPLTAAAPPVAQPQPGTLTPEQEAKARAALEQAEKQVAPIASIPPAVPQTVPPSVPSQADSAAELKAKRELIKQQEREGKKRREAEKKLEQEAARKRVEQEAKTKKEMERLDREAKSKAREEARRKLEAEAKLHQEAKVRGPNTPEKAKLASPSAANPAPASTPPAVKATPEASKAESRKNAVAAPVATGPQTKKQRLDSLTDAYLHDKISAEVYHRERAKVLSEPGD